MNNQAGKGDKDRRDNKKRFANNWSNKCLLCCEKVFVDNDLCYEHLKKRAIKEL